MGREREKRIGRWKGNKDRINGERKGVEGKEASEGSRRKEGSKIK